MRHSFLVFTKVSEDFESFVVSLKSLGSKTYYLYKKTSNYIEVPILYTITDEDEGIMYNINCRFARDIYDDIEKSVCDNFLPNLFQLFIALLIMSVL